MTLKKSFGSAVIAVLLLSLAFSGCENPDYSVEYTDTIPAISGPSNVQAVAYSGLIQVSWDPAPDAKSYDLYRRAVKNAAGEVPANYESKLLGTFTAGSVALNYDDIVSYGNQLQNDWEYEYTVVANSSQSPSGRTVSKDDVVLSAKAVSNKVKAIIPARGTKLATPTVDPVVYYTNLAQSSVTAPNLEEYLAVSWARVPGANYQLAYTFNAYSGSAVAGTAKLGTVTLNYRYASSGINGKGNDPYGYYRFPLFAGGTQDKGDGVKLEVKAYFPTDYYTPSDAAAPELPARTEVVPNDPFASLAVQNFAAVVKNDSDKPYANVPAKVELTWDDLPSASAYTIYKIELATSGSDTIGVGNWPERRKHIMKL
jgi:hypothetical protein